MLAKSLQSCPTLCHPMDCSPPGSPVGLLQAGTLEWVCLALLPEILPTQESNPRLTSPALAGGSLSLAPPGKPQQ